MNKNIYILLTTITIIALSILTGCSNPAIQGEPLGTDSSGTVQFSWAGPGQGGGSRSLRGNVLSRANSIQDANRVVITIEAADGTPVYSQKQLALYNFNGSFISEPISLKVGSYRLTEYLVLNQAGNVIFATPKEGSKNAHLVTDPLPVNFTVTKDRTTKVSPEVVDATTVTPADFGYATFSFAEAKVFNFLVSVMIYDASSDNFILTEAVMDVSTDTKAYSYTLTNTTNQIAINDLTGSYSLTIKKPGYEEYKATYTSTQLKAFFQSPLLITLTKKQAPVNKVINFMISVKVYDSTTNSYIMTDAALDVTADTKSYSFALSNVTNKITVDDMNGSYSLTIKKPGYEEHRATYTSTQLKAFFQSPLLITLTKKQAPVNKVINFMISVKVYDSTTNSYIMTDAALNITANTKSYSFALSNVTNKITVDDINGSYTLTVKKTGYEDYTATYTNSELKAFFQSPLLITLTKKQAPVNKVITFADPNLEAAVRAAIKKPAGDIYPADVARLTYLDANNRSISNLSGIEHLTSLRQLYLAGNSISDISALSSLINLTGLYLYNNRITDISSLSSLTNLAKLSLNANSINNIKPLSLLTKLTYLGLNNNKIIEVSALAGINSGSSITLANNPLDTYAQSVQIPALKARGVNVSF